MQKESTNKIVNSLLDKEPRWLRPRIREEMNERIMGLSKRKSQRKVDRKPKISESYDAPIGAIYSSIVDKVNASSDPYVSGPETDLASADALMFTEFSETPMQDLLAILPWQTAEYGMDQLIPPSELLHYQDFQSDQDIYFRNEFLIYRTCQSMSINRRPP